MVVIVFMPNSSALKQIISKNKERKRKHMKNGKHIQFYWLNEQVLYTEIKKNSFVVLHWLQIYYIDTYGIYFHFVDKICIIPNTTIFLESNFEFVIRICKRTSISIH